MGKLQERAIAVLPENFKYLLIEVITCESSGKNCQNLKLKILDCFPSQIIFGHNIFIIQFLIFFLTHLTTIEDLLLA